MQGQVVLDIVVVILHGNYVRIVDDESSDTLVQVLLLLSDLHHVRLDLGGLLLQ